MEGRYRYTRASDWLIVLQENPGDEDIADRFEAWLDADPAHARDWAEIRRTYDLLGSIRPADRRASPPERSRMVPAATVADFPPLGREGRKQPRAVWRRSGVAATAMSIAAVLVLVVLSGRMMAPDAEFETGTGETRAISLADGSTIQMAPESALSVDFSERERGVRLFEGAAFFQVASDAARPFRVRTDYVDSTVLGTAFEVRLGESATEVAVREGVVGVESGRTTPALSARLEAGDWLRLSAEGGMTRRHLPPASVASWTNRRLVVRDRPVSEVVAFVGGYYSGIILLHGSRLSKEPVTGIYDLSDPVAAIRALARTQHAEVYQISPWVTVVVGD